MMNPTTSTTFVAYRDPRYVQGKALLKAKQYDTAIDALAGNFSSSSSMNTNNSSSSTSGSMMMMMSPTSNNSSNQNSSSNNSNNNNNTENSGFDKPTSNRMGGSGSDGVTTIGFGGSSSSSKMSSNAPTPDSFKSSTGNSANKKDNEPKVEYGFGKQTLPTSTATNILQGRKKSKKRKLDSTSLSLPSSSSSSSGTNLLAVKKKVKVQAVVQGEQSTEAMDIEADEAKTTTTTTVVVVEKTPEEIARENLKKAEKDNKLKQNQIEMYVNRKWYTIQAYKQSKELDVTILRKLILNKILKSKKNIKFVSGFKGKKALENFVNSKKYNLAFRLYPTNISEVLVYADKKKYMPQKSTWFHPKPLDGLISSKIIS